MLIFVPIQIKNLISTTHALAHQEGAQVTMPLLEFAGENPARDVNGAGSSVVGRQSTGALSSYF
jgi:hypothetical protein